VFVVEILSIHLALIGVDVVGINNLPAMILHREADQADSSEELCRP